MKLGEEVTVVVKTFLRPKNVHRLVASIKRFYPDVPIVVVDDGKPLAEQHKPFPQGVTVIKLPFDSGLSAGRNAGVAAVTTPYVILCDDDFVVTPSLPLQDSLVYLKEHEDSLDLLGYRMNGLNIAWWLEKRGDTMVKTRAKKRVGRHIPCEFLMNCFIAKTDVLKSCKWDERLKIREHWDFFFCNRDRLRCGLYTQGSFVHRGAVSGKYAKYRNRGPEMKAILKEKHGVVRFLKRGQYIRFRNARMFSFGGIDDVLSEHPLKWFKDHGLAQGEPTLWTYIEGNYKGGTILCLASLAKHNKNFRIVTPEDLQEMQGGSEVLAKTRGIRLQHRADLVRLFLLEKFGGTWVDSDCLCFRKIDVTPPKEGLRIVKRFDNRCGSSPLQTAFKSLEIEYALAEATKRTADRKKGAKVPWAHACNVLYKEMAEAPEKWKIEVFPDSDLFQPAGNVKEWKKFFRGSFFVRKYLKKNPEMVHLGKSKKLMPWGHAAQLIGPENAPYSVLFKKALGIPDLGRRQEIISRLPEKGVYVSIGVNKGATDAVVLAAKPSCKAILVDTWGNHTQSYIDSNDPCIKAAKTKKAWEAKRAEALRALKPFSDRIEIFEKSSEEVAGSFQRLVDLVFVDADHSYEGVKLDVASWYSKVRSGGWIGGHDYVNPRFPQFGVKKAVDEFAETEGVQVILGKDMTWWVQKP